jgi:hypothetical protein
MSENIDAVKAGAVLMFDALNAIYALHDVEALEPEEGDEAIDGCGHCSELAGAIIHYPCPTVSILLRDMVVEDATSDDELETSEPTQPE